MPRTTSELVSSIIEVDTSVDLAAFILTASELVTEVCVPAGYSDARLELIERWLAAHFYAIMDVRVASEKAGTVAESFQYKLGLMLLVTMYGQQALMLDTKGGLAALSKSLEEGKAQKPGIMWMGNDPCDPDRNIQ